MLLALTFETKSEALSMDKTEKKLSFKPESSWNFKPEILLESSRLVPILRAANTRLILVKVWENSKKLWKHSPAARVSTAFLVLPNFHSCFYNSIETRYMFSIS